MSKLQIIGGNSSVSKIKYSYNTNCPHCVYGLLGCFLLIVNASGGIFSQECKSMCLVGDANKMTMIYF